MSHARASACAEGCHDGDLDEPAAVACRRALDALGVEIWEAVSERDLNPDAAMQVLERTRPSEPLPQPSAPNAEEQIAPLLWCRRSPLR